MIYLPLSLLASFLCFLWLFNKYGLKRRSVINCFVRGSPNCLIVLISEAFSFKSRKYCHTLTREILSFLPISLLDLALPVLSICAYSLATQIGFR